MPPPGSVWKPNFLLFFWTQRRRETFKAICSCSSVFKAYWNQKNNHGPANTFLSILMPMLSTALLWSLVSELKEVSGGRKRDEHKKEGGPFFPCTALKCESFRLSLAVLWYFQPSLEPRHFLQKLAKFASEWLWHQLFTAAHSVLS